MHEQDEQHDRELPQSALDPAAAAIDGRVAAEGAGQAGAARLQQDRGDQGDADDDLADGQDGVHERGRPPFVSARNDTTGVRPAVRQPVGRHVEQRMAGHARPGRQPGELQQRRRDIGQDAVAQRAAAHGTPEEHDGTGLSEWAVTGSPAASRSSSALPWSAVMARSAPGPSGSAASTASTAATTRARQASIVARAVDRRRPDAGVPDHVRVGVVGDDEVVGARPDRLDEGVGHAGRGHLRLQVVGRDASGSGRAVGPRPARPPRRRR